MTYIKKNLLPNETMIFHTKPHMIILIKSIWWFIFSFIFWIFRFNFLGFIILIIAILQELEMSIDYISSEYAITNQRVLIKTGLIRRKSLEMFLPKIESIYVDQSMIGRIFNFGTIIINGIGGNKDVFNYIPNPLGFRRQVQNQINATHHTNSSQ